MSELDIDGSGTIEAGEFLDKLKQFEKDRVADISKCHEIFAEVDDDASGFLDEKEVKQLAKKVGLGDQIKADKGFVKNMIQEMEAGKHNPAAATPRYSALSIYAVYACCISAHIVCPP